MGFKSRSAKNMFKVIVNLKALFYTERWCLSAVIFCVAKCYCRRSYICLAASCKTHHLLSPLGYALPMKRERWQTKSDGEGASAAEVKWLGERSKQKTREVLFSDCFASSSALCVINLYRRLRRHFPHRGKQEE